jgi:AraC-like DNA-binding protein
MERRWSTGARPEHEQFAYWREVVCCAFVRLRPERRGRGAFAGEIRTRPLGPLAVSTVTSQAQRVRRAAPEIDATPEPLVYVNLQTRGTGAVRQGGREALLRPGDFALVDALRPFELQFGGGFRQVSFHVPAEMLADRVADPGALGGQRVARETAVGALVSGYLRAAARCAGPPAGADAQALADHLAGLVALAVRGAAPPALSAARAGHLQAALDEIERGLGDPELSPAAVAARIGVSTRYLHRLFAARAETFGALVLRRRLDAARRDLEDPALAHHTVSAIATRWGFRDASHFGRAFRARYGATPSAHRLSA